MTVEVWVRRGDGRVAIVLGGLSASESAPISISSKEEEIEGVAVGVCLRWVGWRPVTVLGTFSASDASGDRLVVGSAGVGTGIGPPKSSFSSVSGTRVIWGVLDF